MKLFTPHPDYILRKEDWYEGWDPTDNILLSSYLSPLLDILERKALELGWEKCSKLQFLVCKEILA